MWFLPWCFRYKHPAGPKLLVARQGRPANNGFSASTTRRSRKQLQVAGWPSWSDHGHLPQFGTHPKGFPALDLNPKSLRLPEFILSQHVTTYQVWGKEWKTATWLLHRSFPLSEKAWRTPTGPYRYGSHWRWPGSSTPGKGFQQLGTAIHQAGQLRVDLASSPKSRGFQKIMGVPQ